MLHAQVHELAYCIDDLYYYARLLLLNIIWNFHGFLSGCLSIIIHFSYFGIFFLREKYLQLCDAIDLEKADASSAIMDEEEDMVRSLRASPVHPSIKDRTSIDDFEIIKPISRGAFGRVFLAKKRT